VKESERDAGVMALKNYINPSFFEFCL
jgi:hypothetical protein